MGSPLTRRRPLRLAAALLAVPLSLAGCSSGESARDQALEGLERASQAAGLEAQMAGLVGDLSAQPSEQESTEVATELEELDSEASELLASTDTGQAYDEKISAAVEETRGAGTELASAIEKPGAAGEAKATAVRRLQASNQNLTGATELIGTELQDEQGNLSAEDAAALEQTVADVDEAGAAVSEAETAVADSSADSPATDEQAAGDCTIQQVGTDAPPSAVEVETGDLDCTEATAVFEQYFDPSTPKAGSGGSATVGEWFCISNSPGDFARGETVLATCERESDGAKIISRAITN